MLYNVHRDTKADPDGATWRDFFPEWKEEQEAQSEDEMFAAMMLWAKATSRQEA